MFVYYKARIIALLCSLALADGDPIRAGTACAIDSVIQALQSNGSAATSYCKSLARGSELTVTAMAVGGQQRHSTIVKLILVYIDHDHNFIEYHDYKDSHSGSNNVSRCVHRSS